MIELILEVIMSKNQSVSDDSLKKIYQMASELTGEEFIIMNEVIYNILKDRKLQAITNNLEKLAGTHG